MVDDASPPGAADGDGSGLPGTLDELVACLADGWRDGYKPLKTLEDLRDRLRNTRFHLAVLGQFKRGKSTFLNALLGAAFLPAAVVPSTAIPTFIAWGPVPRIRVSHLGGSPPEDFVPTDPGSVRTLLHAFVTEEGNPANQRGVARVELFLPADILRDDVILIDTPGIGSTLQHNTDAAIEVLPECDAALFVVSADPPITEAEIAYLATIRPHIVRLFFVLNKIDYLSQTERAQVEDFLRLALRRAGTNDQQPAIFQLSARQALAARISGDDAALATSGLTLIETQVLHYLAGEKISSLHDSVRAKAHDLAGQAICDLGLKLRALELPLDDLERRSRSFEEALKGIEAERQIARDLLAGDKRRAVEMLEIQAEGLRHEARAHLGAVAQQAIAEGGDSLDWDPVSRAVGRAVPLFFDEKLRCMAADFRRFVEQVVAPHHARADALVASVRRNAADLFDIPLRTALASDAFRLRQEPFWVTRKLSNTLMPSAADLMTRFRSPTARQERLQQQFDEQIRTLVQRNVENLRWTTLLSLDETFRRLSTQLDQRLADTLAVTRGVIATALEQRRSRAERTGAELERLRSVLDRLAGLEASLNGTAMV